MKLQRLLTSSAGTSATLWLPNNQIVQGQVTGWGPLEGVWLKVNKASPLPPRSPSLYQLSHQEMWLPLPPATLAPYSFLG